MVVGLDEDGRGRGQVYMFVCVCSAKLARKHLLNDR